MSGVNGKQPEIDDVTRKNKVTAETMDNVGDAVLKMVVAQGELRGWEAVTVIDVTAHARNESTFMIVIRCVKS